MTPCSRATAARRSSRPRWPRRTPPTSTRPSTSIRSAPTWPRCTARQALTPRRGPPRRRRAPPRAPASRTARENVDDLCDPGTFVEYGSLAVAAQRSRAAASRTSSSARRPTAWSPGLGRVNGDLFDDDRAACAVMSYDYTVLAGTQGFTEPPQEGPPVRAGRAAAAAGGVLHRRRRRPPGRHRRTPACPGSTSRPSPCSAGLSGLVPLVGIVVGPLLRRQRRPARLLRRDHRHRRARTSAWAARP